MGVAVQEDGESLGSAADAILFDGTDNWLPEAPASIPSSSAAAADVAVTSPMTSVPRGSDVSAPRTTHAHHRSLPAPSLRPVSVSFSR